MIRTYEWCIKRWFSAVELMAEVQALLGREKTGAAKAAEAAPVGGKRTLNIQQKTPNI
jgi:hypothetical protein